MRVRGQEVDKRESAGALYDNGDRQVESQKASHSRGFDHVQYGTDRDVRIDRPLES